MAAPFDIHFVPLPEDQQVGGKHFSFGFVKAIGVRGPQKLMNRYFKCLLTLKGSDPFDLSYGTQFPGLLGSNISSVKDAMDAVAIIMEDCNSQMRAMDLRITPPSNERFQSATIAQFAIRNTDGFDVVINVTNAAGEITTAQLPAIATRS